MTKAEIVKEVSKNTGIEATTVSAVVEGFMEAVKGSLAKDENVYLRGFGTFEVRQAYAKMKSWHRPPRKAPQWRQSILELCAIA